MVPSTDQANILNGEALSAEADPGAATPVAVHPTPAGEATLDVMNYSWRNLDTELPSARSHGAG